MIKPFRILAILSLGALIHGCATTVTPESSVSPTAGSATTDSAKNEPTYYIYLAGPEVFLPDPIGAGASKKSTIEQLNKANNWPFKLVGLYPMDNEIEDFAPDYKTGIKIYHANIALMEQAHFVVANMVRFRGPSMDVGTAFEMGYMASARKPVFAYYDAQPFYGKAEQPSLYVDRVAQFYPVSEDKEGVDIHGQSIENFKMEDNLMMIGSLDEGKISSSFEEAILKIAEKIKQNKMSK